MDDQCTKDGQDIVSGKSPIDKQLDYKLDSGSNYPSKMRICATTFFSTKEAMHDGNTNHAILEQIGFTDAALWQKVSKYQNLVLLLLLSEDLMRDLNSFKTMVDEFHENFTFKVQSKYMFLFRSFSKLTKICLFLSCSMNTFAN